VSNWCGNMLTVEGSSERLDAFAAAVGGLKGPAFSLEAIDPMPELLGNSSGWHPWALAHWGTKADVVSCTLTRCDGRLEYRFATAWSPPEAAICQVARRWSDLVLCLTYDESGCDFAGRTVWRDGRVAESYFGSYWPPGFDFDAGEHDDYEPDIDALPVDRSLFEQVAAVRMLLGREPVDEAISSLGSRMICWSQELCEQLLACSPDRLSAWQLAGLASTQPSGALGLQAYLEHPDAYLRGVGRLMWSFGPLISPASPLEKQPSSASWEEDATLARELLTEMLEAGLAEPWFTTLEHLASDWEGTFVELLRSAAALVRIRS
jgi:hypothetical protein